MVQIKLSIAFVLAAAAIAPIVAHPIPGHEHEGGVGTHRQPHHDEVEGFPGHGRHEGEGDHQRHHHEGEHHHEVEHHHEGEHHLEGEGGHQVHHHLKASLPSDPNTPPLSPREYFDEFDVRDLNLLTTLEGDVKTLEGQDARLRQQHQALQREDTGLENKNRHLEHKEDHLEHKDHHLRNEDRKLTHERDSLETQDKSLNNRKHHLEGEDNKLSLKNKMLAKKGSDLVAKNKGLKTNGKVLSEKDKLLKLKGKILAHDNKDLASKGKVLGHGVPTEKGKVLENKVKAPVPVVHYKSTIAAREYDDMFEREFKETGSGSNTLPENKGPSHFRIGTVVRPRHGPLTSQRLPRFGRGVPRRREPFGLGPVEMPHHVHGPVQEPHPHPLPFGPGPVELPPNQFIHPLPVSKFTAREYAEVDELLEREFEDVEIDARDFDELYLD